MHANLLEMFLSETFYKRREILFRFNLAFINALNKLPGMGDMKYRKTEPGVAANSGD